MTPALRAIVARIRRALLGPAIISMPVDEVVERLDAWVVRNQKQAWRPLVRDGEEGQATGSRFGGRPWLAEGEAWPACGACHHPMSFFLQLNIADLPSGWGGKPEAGLLQLFYCTDHECESTRGGWEPFDSGHLARIVVPGAGSQGAVAQPAHDVFPARAITDWQQAMDAPHTEDHRALGLRYEYDFEANTVTVNCDDPKLTLGPLPLDATNEEELELAEALGSCLLSDKLGGWPYWVQGAEYPACPECDQPMSVVFQLDSEENIPFMFGDCGIGHIAQCPRHPEVLSFSWACY